MTMRRWPLIAGVALGAVILAVIRRRLLVTDVTGSSMQPTYSDGDRLLTVRFTRKAAPRPGQVVVLHNPQDRRPASFLIKRVVAVAGQPVPKGLPDGVVPGGVVPQGHVLVLGDNPTRSYDSRNFGAIPVERLVAFVIRKMGH
ncbi:S26 family signal peptidase [Spongiactinospora rosea]|uniref:S26 family signal peptidase n=1 Tax=Spongiactinospora rosea TaxID=2248750 RepID=A0A366LUY0_9ACTN|nr:S26 family signal peptidase [Spongiactinospora rosea]RBQ17731.1 S26 family signal peptidase [Spongiactinospora rosea]